MVAGAIRRGEAWPLGTLVRAAGPKSKVTYKITAVQFHSLAMEAVMECTPLSGTGPGRSIYWTSIEYLREVDE
jgi:hypothetical protein